MRVLYRTYSNETTRTTNNYSISHPIRYYCVKIPTVSFIDSCTVRLIYMLYDTVLLLSLQLHRILTLFSFFCSPPPPSSPSLTHSLTHSLTRLLVGRPKICRAPCPLCERIKAMLLASRASNLHFILYWMAILK